MKFLSLLVFLFIFEETLYSAMADRQFIENTCKGTPSYNLCLSILLSDPKSQNADLTGLALIVADAVKKKSDETLQEIKALKKSRPELTRPLEDCGSSYNIVVTVNVPLTVNAMNLGNPKFAEDGMADTSVETENCEGSFGEYGKTSPMTSMNKAVEDVANVDRAIIRMLL